MAVSERDRSMNETSFYRRTPDHYIASFAPPTVVDLYGYHRNPRPKWLARMNPVQIYWTVGLEFGDTLNLSRGFSKPPNYYTINYGALSFLEFWTRKQMRPPEEIDIYYGLALEPSCGYNRSVLQLATALAQRSVVVCTYSGYLQSLRELGYNVSEGRSFSESDQLSEWVYNHQAKLSKYVFTPPHHT